MDTYQNLIRQATGGDAKAFSELVRRFSSMARAVALQKLRDPALAEDAIAGGAAGRLAASARSAQPRRLPELAARHRDQQLPSHAAHTHPGHPDVRSGKHRKPALG
jgi:hypothetical protein